MPQQKCWGFVIVVELLAWCYQRWDTAILNADSGDSYIYLLMKRGYYILGTVILVGIALTIVAVFNKQSETNTSPPILVNNFVDLSQIDKISKFRSCQGHTVVPVDESEDKRNMKHYFIVKPEYRGLELVALYAPYDAKVSGIRSSPEQGLEGEIWLDGGSEWQFSLEHIQILETINEGSSLRAGELIGHVPDKGFDVVFAIGASSPKQIDGYTSPFAALDSIFLHMGDNLFSEFLKFGISDRQQLVYSKEYRDENPCLYRNDEGGLNDIDHPEDWVILTGVSP